MDLRITVVEINRIEKIEMQEKYGVPYDALIKDCSKFHSKFFPLFSFNTTNNHGP
jgi:hypothetical protein